MRCAYCHNPDTCNLVLEQKHRVVSIATFNRNRAFTETVELRLLAVNHLLNQSLL